MRAREPFNAWSHLVGLLLAVPGTLALLQLASGPRERAAFAIYGGSLILLYTASTVYHFVHASDRTLRWLRTLDHVSIYVLIAGSYTPVAILTLGGWGGWTLLAVVWLIAAAGVPFKVLWLDAPNWLSTGIYLAMGWLAVAAIGPLWRVIPLGGILWLATGGLAYTVGAIIFIRERPNPFPGIFGHHELWHLHVLAGSGCHFIFMMGYVG